ncbi:YmdB family metallophosphoesterase [Aeromicrobium sp.]|nr:YmdB family metallophosphoesterase [Candidatus Saccharibacteria bacterium]
MKIVYVGDVMAEMGIQAVERVLPELRKSQGIDVVIAQAENVTNGKGLSHADYKRLLDAGVNGFTGGNHTTAHKETLSMLRNNDMPVTGPANMHECPGPGFKYVTTLSGKVLIISLLGKIVGRDADKPVDNPIQVIDRILESQAAVERVATVVNVHGDFSSEKVVMGHYLDGRVTAVVGDHWHVPTNDARVLPHGTAHQTDVGMCGSLDSSLGVKLTSVIPRWRDGIQTRNVLETEGPLQFNALLIHTDDGTGLAIAVEPIRDIIAGK